MKYRKKPVEVEAIQYTGDNKEQIRDFTLNHSSFLVASDGVNTCVVYDKLHDTWVGFKIGDYIIKGMQGEFYPCVEEVFVNTYDKVID